MPRKSSARKRPGIKEGMIHGKDVAPSVNPPVIMAVPMTAEKWKESLAFYAPDDDKENKGATIKVDDLYNHLKIPRKVADTVPVAEGGTPAASVDTKVRGTFVVQKVDGSGLREVNVEGWDGLNKLQESHQWRGMKLQESEGITLRGKKLKEAFPDPFTTGADRPQGSTALPNDEFIPLMMGPYSRQLYIYDFLDQAAKGFEGYQHNPVLKAVINNVLNFVLGDGVKVVAANKECQKRWDKFEARVSKAGFSYQDKLRQFWRDVYIIGECFLTDPDEGEGPTMKLIDATTVWEVVTDPRDIEKVYYLHRQFPTQYQIPYTMQGGTEPQVPVSEYVIEQIPADKFLHAKVNATVGEKRGRSDLFSVLGWGKRFKDWFDATVVNGQISNAFILWWKVVGGEADVNALRDNPDFSRVPPPGSAWFTNEQVTPSLLRAEGGLQANDKTGEQLLVVIAVSLNLPPEYLGVGGAVTRATALVRGEPAQRFFSQRQEQVRDTVRWQYNRVMKWEQENNGLGTMQMRKAVLQDVISALRSGEFRYAIGLIKKMITGSAMEEPIDLSCEVVMPNLVPEDRSTKMKDMTAAHMQGLISKETLGNQTGEALGIKNYDFEEERRKLDEEKERGILPFSAMPPSNDKGKFGDPNSNDKYRRENKGMPQPK